MLHTKKDNILKISKQKLNKKNSTSCLKMSYQFPKLIRQNKHQVLTPDINIFFENVFPKKNHIYSTFCYLQYTILGNICIKLQNLINFSEVMLLFCKGFKILSIPHQKSIFWKKDDEFSGKFCAIMIYKTNITIHKVGPKTDLWNLLTLFNYLHNKF